VPSSLLEHAPNRLVAKIRIIRNHRLLVLRMSIAGLIVGLLIALAIPKEYQASAQLMPPDTQSGSGMAMLAALTAKTGSGMGAVAGDLLGMKSSGALFVGVMRSPGVQEDLVKKFDLRKVYDQKLLIDARATLDQNTSIVEDRKSGIITIMVTDRNPKRAADLANAYIDRLNSLVVDLSTSSAHRERVFLEERLTDVKRDLDDASTQLAEFSSKNSTIDIQQQGKAMFDAAGNLSSELIGVESELKGLRQVYTAHNVRVRSLTARSEELRKQLDRLGGSGGEVVNANPPRESADGIQLQKKLITERLANSDRFDLAKSTSEPAADPPASQAGDLPYPSIRQLPLLGARFADYYRRAKVQETLYELLTEQYELAKVEEAKETPSVKILDAAKLPEKKFYPPRLLIALMGMVLSFALTIAWILGASHWRGIDPTDPQKLAVQEVYGMIKSDIGSVTQYSSALKSKAEKMRERVFRHGRLVERPE
jgi:capsule polysaccharide export protein KpsE/RkpR